MHGSKLSCTILYKKLSLLLTIKDFIENWFCMSWSWNKLVLKSRDLLDAWQSLEIIVNSLIEFGDLTKVRTIFFSFFEVWLFIGPIHYHNSNIYHQFLSILYWSSSEYWSQTSNQNNSIHSIKLDVYAVKQSVQDLSFISSQNKQGEKLCYTKEHRGITHHLQVTRFRVKLNSVLKR